MTTTDNHKKIINIVIHARGGQGAVTASQFIAEAAFLSGELVDAHAYPSFGAERRGAPIQAYAKLSTEEQIWDRSFIQHPDILIVFDESVINKEIVSSLEKDGTFIVNSDKDPSYFKETYNIPDQTTIIVADITKLAIENDLLIDGNPIVNTPILGLLAKALPILTIENLETIVNRRMGKELSSLNNELIRKGYNLAKTL
jgi:2-oxoacid:acceptor oxidoreductase gamma subunit (pyruvate/2-ketoisovalerate family)